MIELLIVLVIVLVAASIFASTVAAMSNTRWINRENALAIEAARVVVEQMHNKPFSELWARYNKNDADDPDGPGTAVGHRFAVAGLSPTASSPDGLVGEIFLPAMAAPVLGPPVWELREDFVDASLGMPRDLNGDLVVDSEDHSEDYFLLPVLIRVEWAGHGGDRRIELFTMMCELRYED